MSSILSRAAPRLRVALARRAVAARVSVAAPRRLFGARAGAVSVAHNKKEVVHSASAPPAIGPYSQAVKAGGMVYLSGALGLDAKGNMTANDVAGQAEQVMANLGHVLKAAGCTFDDVVKTTILLADMSDFVKVNEIYAKCMRRAHTPHATRHTAHATLALLCRFPECLLTPSVLCCVCCLCVACGQSSKPVRTPRVPRTRSRACPRTRSSRLRPSPSPRSRRLSSLP